MTTTTPGAIRDVIIARIAGLSPSSPTSPRYIAHRDEQSNLITWASKNPTACLRRFDVERVGGPRGVVVTPGANSEAVSGLEMRIVVSYPASQRFVNGRGLDDVVDADMTLILGSSGAGTIGFSVLPTSNATIVDDGWDFDRSVPGVVLAISPLRIENFWRAI